MKRLQRFGVFSVYWIRKRRRAGAVPAFIGLQIASFSPCISIAVAILHNASMLIARLASIEPFLQRNVAARGPMARWVKLVEQAQWHSIVDARRTLPTADAIKGTILTCFNIGGNSYRLVTIVSYQRQEVTIVELMTHAEYSKKYA